MLTTIILFFALLITVIAVYFHLSSLINLSKDEEDYDEFEFGLLIITCLLWAWLYYLTTH